MKRHTMHERVYPRLDSRDLRGGVRRLVCLRLLRLLWLFSLALLRLGLARARAHGDRVGYGYIEIEIHPRHQRAGVVGIHERQVETNPGARVILLFDHVTDTTRAPTETHCGPDAAKVADGIRIQIVALVKLTHIYAYGPPTCTQPIRS